MDLRSQPAVNAIKSGNAAGLREFLHQDPSLAVSRSRTSHPTLLQCLVLNSVAGTGLHHAALNGPQRMVEFLIEHGADKSIRDLKVRGTAMAWAEHAGHIAIKTYLETA